jgi:hypothetical protein
MNDMLFYIIIVQILYFVSVKKCRYSPHNGEKVNEFLRKSYECLPKDYTIQIKGVFNDSCCGHSDS